MISETGTNLHYVAQKRRVREDKRFVTGAGNFVQDIALPGTKHAAVLPSPYPRARILSIDTAAAEALDGVRMILTGAQLARDCNPIRLGLKLPRVKWYPLAVDLTRYAGEWVAIVVADDAYIAEDALDLIEVEYEPLEAVVDPEAAFAERECLVHPEHGSNVLYHGHFLWGDVDGGFAAADHRLSLRTRWGRSGGGHELQLYREQPYAVSRDLARQVISETEAERLRLEVSHRLLSADRLALATGDDSGSRANPVLAGLVALAIFGGAFWLYAQLGAQNYRDLPLGARIAAADTARADRPTQDAIEARFSALAIDPNADQRHLALMNDLREALQSRPDDLRGHILLARNEAELGNYVAAHKALSRVIGIRGTDAAAVDFVNYAEMLILAAGGYVSPRAEAALREALLREPEAGAARYYVGLMYAQNERPDLAFSMWRRLLEDSGPGALWVEPIRGQIEFMAASAGVRDEIGRAHG